MGSNEISGPYHFVATCYLIYLKFGFEGCVIQNAGIKIRMSKQTVKMKFLRECGVTVCALDGMIAYSAKLTEQKECSIRQKNSKNAGLRVG